MALFKQLNMLKRPLRFKDILTAQICSREAMTALLGCYLPIDKAIDGLKHAVICNRCDDVICMGNCIGYIKQQRMLFMLLKLAAKIGHSQHPCLINLKLKLRKPLGVKGKHIHTRLRITSYKHRRLAQTLATIKPLAEIIIAARFIKRQLPHYPRFGAMKQQHAVFRSEILCVKLCLDVVETKPLLICIGIKELPINA